MSYKIRKSVVCSLMVIALIFGGMTYFPIRTFAAQEIKLGALFDLTGATSDVGWHYVDGIRDYIKYINEEQDGIGNGVEIKLVWTDYQYKIPQAISAYTKFVKRDKVVAILGWGTGQKLAELAGDAAEGYLGIMPFSIWSDDNEGVQLAHTLNSKYHPNIEYREPQYN